MKQVEAQMLAEDIVVTVLRTLSDRKGFQEWWDDIDDDIATEISRELVSKVIAELPITEGITNGRQKDQG